MVMASQQQSAYDGDATSISSNSAGMMLPAPKRQKISLACDVCRARKSKCDGTRPSMFNHGVGKLNPHMFAGSMRTLLKESRGSKCVCVSTRKARLREPNVPVRDYVSAILLYTCSTIDSSKVPRGSGGQRQATRKRHFQHEFRAST